jgi:hypothetical protein
VLVATLILLTTHSPDQKGRDMQEYAMARHSQRSIAVLALLSVFAMLAAGCGTAMQTSSENLNPLTATEGIVVGSVHIKGGKDILGRTGWTLIAQRITGPLSALAPDGLGYRLNASRPDRSPA